MVGHDIIVVGASAGGMEALQALVRGLPPDLPAALFVVWHMPPHSFGVLPEVLERAGPLRAVHAHDGDGIVSGRIYVAPPDQHLLLDPGQVRLTRGPKENHFRPAVDPLFQSAAAAYGPRVIGVVLSGLLDDGTSLDRLARIADAPDVTPGLRQDAPGVYGRCYPGRWRTAAPGCRHSAADTAPQPDDRAPS